MVPILWINKAKAIQKNNRYKNITNSWLILYLPLPVAIANYCNFNNLKADTLSMTVLCLRSLSSLGWLPAPRSTNLRSSYGQGCRTKVHIPLLAAGQRESFPASWCHCVPILVVTSSIFKASNRRLSLLHSESLCSVLLLHLSFFSSLRKLSMFLGVHVVRLGQPR